MLRILTFCLFVNFIHIRQMFSHIFKSFLFIQQKNFPSGNCAKNDNFTEIRIFLTEYLRQDIQKTKGFSSIPPVFSHFFCLFICRMVFCSRFTLSNIPPHPLHIYSYFHIWVSVSRILPDLTPYMLFHSLSYLEIDGNFIQPHLIF